MVQSVCLSVRPSVTPFWLCCHHRIIMKFSGVNASDRSDVHAKGRGQRSKVKVCLSVGLSVRPSVCHTFLAATKQLYKWYFPSVCPSVCLSHLFDYVPIIVSSWNFQELLPMTKVRSMQKVKVRGQRSRSRRSTPNLAVSGLQFEFTYGNEIMHTAGSSIEEVPYCF